MFKFLLYLILLFQVTLSPNAKDIAYVDMEYIIGNSNAAAQMKTQIQAVVDEFQKDMQTKQKIISTKETELKNKASVLSEEVLIKEQQELLSQFKLFESELEQKKKSLDTAYANSLRELQTHIQKIVVELSEQNNYKFVLNKSTILYAMQSLNISDEVIVLLNKRHPKIDLVLEND